MSRTIEVLWPGTAHDGMLLVVPDDLDCVKVAIPPTYQQMLHWRDWRDSTNTYPPSYVRLVPTRRLTCVGGQPVEVWAPATTSAPRPDA